MKWVCGMHGAEENCIRVLVGKPKLKRLLGIPRRKDKTSVYQAGEGGREHELDSSGARQG